jgi:hypothetical protein
MKAKKIVIVVVLFTSICGSILAMKLMNGGQQNKLTEILSADIKNNIDELPISYMKGSFVVDMENKNETVGLVDYVFVAKVISNNKTIYKDIVTMETENGEAKEVGTPYTQYTIEVIDNIKGKLKKNNSFEILKHGGIEQELESIYIFEDDVLPQENNYYIFLGYAQDDGTILISGPNSNILLNANSKQEIVSSNEYKEYKKAFKNEIKFERERSKSNFEE